MTGHRQQIVMPPSPLFPMSDNELEEIVGHADNFGTIIAVSTLADGETV